MVNEYCCLLISVADSSAPCTSNITSCEAYVQLDFSNALKNSVDITVVPILPESKSILNFRGGLSAASAFTFFELRRGCLFVAALSRKKGISASCDGSCRKECSNAANMFSLPVGEDLMTSLAVDKVIVASDGRHL